MDKCLHTFFQNNPGKIITRFNFNSLFSQAWLRAVNPANIIGGFKRSGVCPYDPTAVRIGGPGSDGQTQSPSGNSDTSSGAEGHSSNHVTPQTSEKISSEGKDLGNGGGASVDTITNGESSHTEDDPADDGPMDNLTPKQLELFEQRFEEGYICRMT